MRKLRKFSLASLLLVSLAVVAACGGGGGRDLSSLELNIGTILPLTGDLSQFGPPMENGAELAVQQIQDCNTMTVNATYEDSGTNEQTAAMAADKLIGTDNVGAIVGAASSRVSFAVADPAVQSGVVQISPASTNPDFSGYEDNGFFFRTVPSDALQGIVLAQIARDAGYETVNTIALDNGYGQVIADVFTESFTDRGGEVGVNVPYDPQGTSFASEVQQASQGNPDAILVVAVPETGGMIMQAAREQGLVGEVPFLFTDGLADPEFPQEVGVDLANEQGTRPVSEGPGAEEFSSAFEEEFGSQPSTFSANTYDAVMLAALAAAAGGAGDGQTVQENMQPVSEGGSEVLPSNICSGLELAANGEDINYEGAAGSQNFDENGDVSSQYEIWEFDQEGQLSQVEIVEPPETSEPQ